MDALEAKLRIAGEMVRLITGEAHDPVGHEEGGKRIGHRTRGEDDRKRAHDRLLPFAGLAKRPLGRQLLGMDAAVFHQQGLEVFGLAGALHLFQMQLDQDGDLGPQDEGVDRFEHHVHRARRIGLEEVGLVAEHRRQEDDRRIARPAVRADEARRLIAVHPRHVQVQENDRELLGQKLPQRILARAGDDQLVAKFLQRMDGGIGVALIVIDDEDLCSRPHVALLPRRRGLPGLVRAGKAVPHQATEGAMLTTPSEARRMASARCTETRRTLISWSMSTGLET